ncbi:MAG: 50S ribosomal protein L21 [Nitrospirae bacterium]|nr:MAG: 50S ribosomal protein L21 [Nitrospirota bacterium]
MYAVMETGGKQYRVMPGAVVRVEKLDAPEGESVDIDRVLLVSDEGKTVVGTPFVEGATVKATVLETSKARKVLVFKKKPRKGFKRLRGHRQYYTKLKIDDIVYGG